MDKPTCKTDPRAPHGFLRNASHNAGRYVCECEYWVDPERKKILDELVELGQDMGLYDKDKK
jgi:hypothetical protein